MTDETTEPDDIGRKFCAGMSVISGRDPDKCLKAWERLKSKTIQEDTFNEYLDEEYGAGNAHTVKEILLALIHQD